MNTLEKLQKLAQMHEEPVHHIHKPNRMDWNISDWEEWFGEWCARCCSESFERSRLSDGGIMYKLVDGCVFNRNHKDASVIIRDDGPGYHCFHESCSNKHWSDFRAEFDHEVGRYNKAWQR